MNGKHAVRVSDRGDVLADLDSLVRRGQFRAVTRLADTVSDDEPVTRLASYRFYVGIAYERVGRNAEAEEQFRLAWNCPDYTLGTEADACRVLALAKANAGKTDDAGRLLVRAEQLVGTDPVRLVMVYGARAKVAYQSGHYAAAAWWYERAARMWAACHDDDLARETDDLLGWLKALTQAHLPTAPVYRILVMSPYLCSGRRTLARLYRYLGPLGVRWGDRLESSARVIVRPA